VRPDLTSRTDGQGSLVETILGAVGDGIIVFDKSGSLLFANQPAASAFGAASVDEILAHPLADVMTKFDIMDEEGEPFPTERLPGRLVLAGAATRPETILRFRIRATGEERWSAASARPLYGDDGEVEAAISIFRDITDLKRTEVTQRFLAEATEILNRSLDLHETIASLARLAVPTLADWCVVHRRGEQGGVEPLVLAHSDPEKVRWSEELGRRWPAHEDERSVIMQVLESGRPQLFPEVGDDMLAAAARDDEHLELIRSVGMRSAMTVPVVGRTGVLGTMTFVSAETGRRYGDADLNLAQGLAQRAGFALENALLYEQAEARGHAALVLSHIEDGVFLVDGDGIVRLWNAAAARLTGLAPAEMLGRAAEEALPGWADLAPLVRLGSSGEPGSAPIQSLPLDLGGRELWVAASGVAFEEGIVYAFRDLTSERDVDELKTEFLATASHELRTPLAAVYGAAMTLRRTDLDLDEEQRGRLLDIVSSESNRLTRIVDDILWASRVDSGRLEVSIEQFDPLAVANGIAEAARAHLPAGIELVLSAPAEPAPVVGDADKVRQVLSNLVENAVKYSPDGGKVEVRLEPQERRVLFSVRDEGLGIPPGEQSRIFEKFYRLDPNLTRGVGGTGLGLYICRELVRRMGGRIWVASTEGEGSTFFFDIPAGESGTTERESATRRATA
jgi:PAS domain S-box-containing protein